MTVEESLDSIERTLKDDLSNQIGELEKLFTYVDEELFPKSTRAKARERVERPWAVTPAPSPAKKAPTKSKAPTAVKSSTKRKPKDTTPAKVAPMASPRPACDSLIPVPSMLQKDAAVSPAEGSTSLSDAVLGTPSAGTAAKESPRTPSTPQPSAAAGPGTPAGSAKRNLRLNPTVIPRRRKPNLSKVDLNIQVAVMSNLLMPDRFAVAQTCRSLFIAALSCTMNELELLEKYASPQADERARRRVTERREQCELLIKKHLAATRDQPAEGKSVQAQ